MARSRYANTPIVDGSSYGSWNYPTSALGYAPADLLVGVACEQYVWKRGDRFDKLAATRWGIDQYGWIIALANGYSWAFGVAPGATIMIPFNYNDVLAKLP